MIHFFVGTTAELIKLMPVMLELRRRDLPYRYIDAGQHAETTASLRKHFKLAEPDVTIGSRANDVATIRAGLKWLLRMATLSVQPRARITRDLFHREAGICVIHGDTASTLLGCLLARRAGLRVAHIEAGLRSGNYFNPFPEEIIRVTCMRLCDYLFAPSQAAVSNLLAMRLKGQIVPLPANTALDAIRIAQTSPFNQKRPAPYAVATCHRLETIMSKRRLSAVLEMLRTASRAVPVLFVQHQPTQKAMARWGLNASLNGFRIEPLPPQPYLEFVGLLRHAEFVLTDGGSIQEECSYLGIPCFLMRHCTERVEGLGENVVIGGYDSGKLLSFLATYPMLRRSESQLPSPSAIIADHLGKFAIAPCKPTCQGNWP